LAPVEPPPLPHAASPAANAITANTASNTAAAFIFLFI
jgi:hypothetical protein